MPKKIFTQELGGTRRRGRLRERWKEEIERDLQVLGVRRWRELVADRKKLKDIVRQAKAHTGLKCQWKKKTKKKKIYVHLLVCYLNKFAQCISFRCVPSDFIPCSK